MNNQAAAQEPVPAPKIGVLDMQKIMREAEAAKKARADREGYAARYKTEISTTEKELRDADQELARQRSILAPEAFNEKRQAFQQRLATFQRDVQVRRQSLERAMGTVMNQIQREVIRISDEVAAERGANMVLYRAQVFMFDPAMDITERVLSKLNASLPAVAFPDPSSLKPANAN